MKGTRELLGSAGAQALDMSGVAERYRERHLGGLTRVASLLGVNLDVADADGGWLTLGDGSRVLDCQASNGAVAVGHMHPAVVRAARAALDSKGLGFPGLLPSRDVAALCQDLISIAPPGMTRAILYNTGAETIEGALVIAALAQRKRDVYVGFEGGFHGKSAAARAVGGIPAERDGFPDWANTETLPYGDLNALEALLRRVRGRVAAVVAEPIQSNSGVRIPPPGFLTGLRDACRKAGALLVLDEVSTGLGRTGEMFACQHENVAPDLMCLSKGLSGGLVPSGAVLVNERLAKVMDSPRKASHFSTTFAGGRLAAAVGMEVIRLLVEERLPEQADRLGRQLGDGLDRLKAQHPRLVRAVRGRGLMWGIELADPVDIPGSFLPRGASDFLASRVGGSVAIAMQRYLLEHHGVLLAPTAADRRVVRMFPPLTSKPADIAHLLQGLEGALEAGLSAWVRNLS